MMVDFAAGNIQQNDESVSWLAAKAGYMTGLLFLSGSAFLPYGRCKLDVQ
jgi:hypothetical protein